MISADYAFACNEYDSILENSEKSENRFII